MRRTWCAAVLTAGCAEPPPPLTTTCCSTAPEKDLSWQADAAAALYASVTPPDPSDVIGRIVVRESIFGFETFYVGAEFWSGGAPALEWPDPSKYGTCALAASTSPEAGLVSAGTLFFDDGAGDPEALLTSNGRGSTILRAEFGTLFAVTSSGGEIAPFDLDPAFALPAPALRIDGWPKVNDGQVPVGDVLWFTWGTRAEDSTILVQLDIDRVDPATSVITRETYHCPDDDDGTFLVEFDPLSDGADSFSAYLVTVERRQVRYAQVEEGWVEIVTASAAGASFDYLLEDP